MPRANPIDGGEWGLMGGIFDPVHNGHLILAECARQAFNLSRIILVPSCVPPHREQKPVATFDERIEMTELAVEGNDYFIVSDLEKDIRGPGYTLLVVDYLETKYPGVNWNLILGADNVVAFNIWYKPEELIKRIKIIVGGRPGYESRYEKSAWADKVTLFTMPRLEISSTGIRKAIRKNKSIRYQVPESVRQYIIDHGLYR